jgi:DNA-binding transcriptional LysR family regulator
VERQGFQRIRYLAAALRHGSMRAAADSLDIAPSVVSRQIALLEKELGLTLLEKNGRKGVTGSEAAQVLVECHEEQQASVDHALTRLDNLRTRMDDSLRVVASEGFLPALGDALGSLLARAQSPLTLDFMSVPELTRELLEERAHFALVFAPMANPELEVIAHAHQPLHLIVPAAHELALRGEPVDFPTIAGYPLALTSPSIGIRQLVRRVETYEKVSLRPELTTTSLEIIKTYVLSGRGISLLPVFAVAEEIRAGQVVALPVANATFLSSEACILMRRGQRLSRAGREVLEHLRHALTIFQPS